MATDLANLADDVVVALNSFSIPEAYPPQALGTALPSEWYETGLAEMRAALVSPYWIEMRDLDPQSKALVILKVAVVADDGHDKLIVFDPEGQGKFVLCLRDPDPDSPRGIDVVSCGIRGDAVGCFLSR